MNIFPRETHIWLNVNHTDLPTRQNIFNRIHASAIEMTSQLPKLNKPGEERKKRVTDLLKITKQ